MWEIGIMPRVTIYNHPKWIMQKQLLNFFQNSIIMPHGKNQLGHVDQFKTIKYGLLKLWIL